MQKYLIEDTELIWRIIMQNPDPANKDPAGPRIVHVAARPGDGATCAESVAPGRPSLGPTAGLIEPAGRHGLAACLGTSGIAHDGQQTRKSANRETEAINRR